MSGPKSFTVSTPPGGLSALTDQTTRQEDAEWTGLSKKLDSAVGDLRQTIVARLALLNRRRARRAEQERRAKQQDEQWRAQMRAEYDACIASLNDAMQDTQRCATQHPGLNIPKAPAAPGLDLSPSGNVAEILASMRQQISEFQQAIDTALGEYLARTAALDGQAQWAGGFAAFAVEKLRALSESYGEMQQMDAQKRERAARVKAILARAQAAIEAVQNAGAPLATNTVAQVETVWGCNDPAQAEIEWGKLERFLEADQAQHRASLERQEAVARIETERAQAQQQDALTEQITRSLEELGFEVSELQASAMPQEGGALLAFDRDWPNHVLKVELGEQKRISPLRIVGGVEPQTTIQDKQLQDAAFEESWCGSKGRMANFRKSLKAREITVTFRREHGPGDIAPEPIHIDQVPQAKAAATPSVAKPQERARSPVKKG